MSSRLIVRNLISILKRNEIDANFKRAISLYPISFNESKKFEESDWFNKLTDTKLSTSDYKNVKNRQKYQDLSIEDKKNMIDTILNFRRENGLPAPKEVDEKSMQLLLRSESYTHLTKTMVYLVKQEHYEFQKQQKRLERENRKRELPANLSPHDVITNYPGADSFLRRINFTEMRRYNRRRVYTSIVTNEPSLVFDFRFIKMHTRLEILKSMYKQFIQIIGVNRDSVTPFQLHFCNYDYQSEFHEKFSNFLQLDNNMIFDTPKSYMDIFPKEKLVYLSRDAKIKMTKFDPEKVYIVGSMIDIDDKFKYSSYSQAKKDGIRCERLPIDDYVRWNRGQKSLNMDHVFQLMLNLKHGQDWMNALKNSLPRRKIEDGLDKNEFEK